MAAALRAAFASVDAEILARCRGRGGREGTTALVALRVGRQLWTAHLGDARAVLARVEREKEKKGRRSRKKVANGGVAKGEAEAGEDDAAAAASKKEVEEEERGDAKATPAPAPASTDDNALNSDDDDDDDDALNSDVKRAGPTIITRSPQSPCAAAAPLLRQEQHKAHPPPFLRSLWQHTHQNGSVSNTTAAAAAAAAAAKNAPPRASSQPPSSNSRIKAVRLTHDHKPDLPHERARVLAAGGRVEWQGCWRVVAESPLPGRPAAGLAVSRSLGDAQFKEPLPLVSSDPDVSVTLLMPGDTMLILASDGVWDVLSDQDAAEVAVAAALKAAAAVASEEEEDEEREAEAAGGGGNDEKNERGAAAAAAAVADAAGAKAGPEKAASEEEAKKNKEENSDDDDEDPSSLGLNVPLRSGFCPIATAAAEAVIAAALSRGTMDNVTALCAVLPWEW